MTARGISRLIGAIVGFVGLGFVANLFWTRRSELQQVMQDAEAAWLVLAVVVGLVGMATIGVVWHRLVVVLGGEMSRISALRGYFVGQLGKYVPGGVWAVIGRGSWARQEGVSMAVSYSSTMLSMGTAYTAGALLAGLMALVAIPSGTVGAPLLVGAVAVLGPVGLLAVHPTVFRLVLRVTRRISKRQVNMEVPKWSVSISITVFQLLAWVGIATATWLVGLALGLDHGWVTVTLATCTSWVAGFLFLPVPGGIGIRESAFLAVLGADPGVAAMALAARLLFVAVDALGATISTAAVKGAARRDTASHTTVSPGSNDAA